MSIESPARDWFKPPSAGERAWVGLALLWCLVLTVAMPYWHLKGKQNSTGESYSVEPARFAERVQRFAKAHTVGTDNGIPIVEAPPGGDAYLQAQMWTFFPVLQFKKGQTYRLHVSAMDLQHGLSVQPINMNFQVLPGYDHVLTITPTMAGEFPIVCNEFCGIGHHQMTGKIIVTE